MMRRHVLLIILTSLYFSTLSQSPETYLFKLPISATGKLAIDFGSFKKWGGYNLTRAAIAGDGRYCSYLINQSLVVQSTENNWKQEIGKVKPGFFSGNNKEYIYLSADSLCFLSLGKGSVKSVHNVISYQAAGGSPENKWIAWQLNNKTVVLMDLLSNRPQQFDKARSFSFSPTGAWFSCLLDNPERELVTVQLSTGKTIRYQQVLEYSFDKGKLVIKTIAGDNHRLQWAKPGTGKTATIWTGSSDIPVGPYVLDETGRQIAFLLYDHEANSRVPSLWYFKDGMQKAIQKVQALPSTMEAGLVINGISGFSNGGGHIVFSLHRQLEPKPIASSKAIQLNVWHYKDTILMSEQVAGKTDRLKSWLAGNSYYAVVPAEKQEQPVQLTYDHESLGFENAPDYWLVHSQVMTDRLWEAYSDATHYLTRADGSRLPLKKELNPIGFAPNKSWLLCHDGVNGRYIRYDMASGQYTDLCGSDTTWFGDENEFREPRKQPTHRRGLIGWMQRGASLLVYDYYDIWQLDAAGQQPPVCLTNHYGRKNNIRLEVLPGQVPATGILPPHSPLILNALNMANKDNGFFFLRTDTKNDPELLSMGAWLIYPGTLAYGHIPGGMPPLRAKEAATWLVMKESAIEAPNLFFTRDLRSFKPVTHIYPHKDHNWLRTRLVHFYQQDGTTGQGVLYTPENFDTAKKYAVLINYYEQESLELNSYLYPAHNGTANLNIPWIVSRGYLVFKPDICFNKLSSGAAALNAVEGAANWLASQPYVDSTRMGIMGHSFGGGLTNFIVTHSTRFAAAFEGAGISNWVSSALQLNDDLGRSRIYSSIEGLLNKSDSIWHTKEKYTENPIMQADQVTTPLLMFHCKLDYAVPFAQAVELFVALRRLGKKVWLLQYDQGGHGVAGKDAEDLTVRATQFFDHYLRGAPPPLWMTTGIRAQQKGKITGLELDYTGRKP